MKESIISLVLWIVLSATLSPMITIIETPVRFICVTLSIVAIVEFRAYRDERK